MMRLSIVAAARRRLDVIGRERGASSMCGLFFCPEKGSKGTDIVGMYDVKTRLKKYVSMLFALDVRERGVG